MDNENDNYCYWIAEYQKKLLLISGFRVDTNARMIILRNF